MPKSHNKKRNVGVVYELLLRRVSECLINEDTEGAQKTLNIISKRFRKGTALYKEFRLFRALAKSEVSDRNIAQAIISEAKYAARETDAKQLDREKSQLIREMNYTLGDSNLYRRFIPNYKTLATIQVLLNDWRDGSSANIERIAMYESKVIDHLVEEKKTLNLEEEVDYNVDPLVVKIMSEKLNKKYSNKFDSDQQEILKIYSFASLEEGTESRNQIENLLENVKSKVVSSVDNLEKTTENETLREKIELVRSQIINESKKDLSDQKIVRFLTLIDLCKEIKESSRV